MYKTMCFPTKWMSLNFNLILVGCTLTTFSQNTAAADANSKLINYKSDGLSYSFETDNGIKRTEIVELKNLETPVIVFSGSYSYTDPKGVKVTVEYVADEKGYAPRVKIGKVTTEAPSTFPPVPSFAYAVGGDVIESLIHNG